MRKLKILSLTMALLMSVQFYSSAQNEQIKKGGGVPAGGQLPNGWTYCFSVSQILDLNGNNFAEEGVAPDIAINFDWSDLTRDEIIERAIEEILK